MAKTPSKAPKTSADPSSSMPDFSVQSAHNIWLAGLGAMAKAQEQGSKAMEALVNDGLALQRKSQAEAQQRLQEATERLTHMATDLGQQASVRVDKLEHLFEDRVAKALHRLGMPTLLDMQMLTARIEQLEAQLNAAPAADRTPPRTAKTAVSTPKPTGSNTSTSASKPAAKPGTKPATKTLFRKSPK
ncbi:phasin family protein [Limnohabitans sp. DM1]|uniref:phasin family protein n=1 Tax=Limnohabitans sp. DM1 TaxID=1597955 RepID=UPI000A8CB145|nr:phasin family protein [Limnohabitans sp. DM1]